MALGLSRWWWVLAFRGVLAIAFGVLAFVYPWEALTALAIVFGVYALIDGAFAIGAALTGGGVGHWFALLLEGVLGILAGVIAILSPMTAVVALILVVAAWSIVTGVVEVVAAIRLRKAIEDEWALGLSGVLSVLFGVLLLVAFLAAPLESARIIAYFLGAYAVLFGVLMLMLAFRLRSWGAGRGARPSPP